MAGMAGQLNGFALRFRVTFVDDNGFIIAGRLTDITHTTATPGIVYLTLELDGQGNTPTSYELEEHTRVTVTE
jgi:hypothetical protein